MNITTETRIGIIESAEFGFLHHDRQLLGVNFSFKGDGWMSSTGLQFELQEKADEQNLHYLVDVHAQNIKVLSELRKLMKDADVVSIEQLVGKQVEVTFRDKATDDPSPFIGKKFDSLRIIKE
jgi:hypothetical protein